jgi:hypothetical protein
MFNPTQKWDDDDALCGTSKHIPPVHPRCFPTPMANRRPTLAAARDADSAAVGRWTGPGNREEAVE